MVAAHLLLLPVVVFAKERQAFARPKLVAAALLALLPGLALYGWLPWRASAHPPLAYHPPVEVSEVVDGKTVTRWMPGDLATWPGLNSYLAREFPDARAQGSATTRRSSRSGGELAREWTGFALALVRAAGSRARGGALVLGVACSGSATSRRSRAGAWWDVFLHALHDDRIRRRRAAGRRRADATIRGARRACRCSRVRRRVGARVRVCRSCSPS